jgi:hypothetical protein
MKKSAQILVALLTLGSLAACKDPTPVEIVDMATKELGMPVFFWADLNDECAVRQLRQFWSDYEGTDKKPRKAIRKRLQEKYSALIINPSENVGEMTGTIRELMLVDRDCRSDVSKCERRRKETKFIGDERRTDSGSQPGTRLVKERQGQITPYRAADKSTRLTLATNDAQLFGFIRSTQDLDSAARAGRVWRVAQTNAAPLNCGRIAGLSELF